MLERIKQLQVNLSNVQDEMKPLLLRKEELMKEVREISDKLRIKAMLRYNIEHEESIEEYYTESACTGDVHVNIDKGIVLVRTDNPRTRHCYDETFSEYTIESLLEK